MHVVVRIRWNWIQRLLEDTSCNGTFINATGLTEADGLNQRGMRYLCAWHPIFEQDALDGAWKHQNPQASGAFARGTPNSYE